MRRTILLAAALAAMAGPALGREVTPAERRTIPYVAELPLCGDTAVLERVAEAFAAKEAQFWNSNLTIVDYETIRPVAFRPWGLDHIPRRFCTATATVSNGRRHRVDYSVREDLDLIGSGWGVEFCLQGLDRNLAFSPSCRMARP